MRTYLLLSCLFLQLLLAPIFLSPLQAGDGGLTAVDSPILFGSDSPAVAAAALPDGNVAVLFAGTITYLQKFQLDGTPLTVPVVLEDDLGYQLLSIDVFLESNSSGQLATTFRSTTPFPFCISAPAFLRVYDSGLEPVSPPIPLYGPSECTSPPVAISPDGDVLRAWRNLGGFYPPGLYFNSYSAVGTQLLEREAVAKGEFAWSSSVRLRGGASAFAWSIRLSEESRMKFIDGNGNLSASFFDITEFGTWPKLEDHPSGSVWGLSSAGSPANGILNLWRASPETGARLLSVIAEGIQVDDRFSNIPSALTVDELGYGIVIWRETGGPLGPGPLMAQGLDPRGRPLGAATVIEGSIEHIPTTFAVEAVAPGVYLVLWPTDAREIYGQVYALELPPCPGGDGFCRE